MSLCACLCLSVCSPSRSPSACVLLHPVICRWEKFSAAVSAPEQKGQPGVVAELFPFTEYFADAPQPLFKPGASYEDDMEVCLGLFGWLRVFVGVMLLQLMFA